MLDHLHMEHHQGSKWRREFTHKHNEYHFYIITYGSCQFSNERNHIIAHKGDFVLIPPYCTFIEQSTNKGIGQKFSFSFTAHDLWINQLPLLLKNEWVHQSSGVYDRSVEKIRPLLKEAQEDQPYTNLRIGALLVDIFCLWQREQERGELAPASLIHIERMKDYITTHYREHVTKEVLADYIRRSPSYAATLFKKGTSQTISEYVHASRMKTAMYMLSASLLSITEISEYLGYSDVSYFQRIFKRTFGQPASFYMEQRERDNG